MTPQRVLSLQRYTIACLVASLVTLGLLFVMTQLISPIGGDPVVQQMLQQLELQRRLPPDAPGEIRVFELPPKPESQQALRSATDENDAPKRPEQAGYDEDKYEATQDDVIDWWAQARAIIQDLGDAESEEWLQSQQYERWVSVMQGPMPSAGASTILTEQGDSGSAYRNVYGDFEVPINESCVLQLQPRPFDASDFARNIPPRIVCKGASKKDLAGLEEYLDKRKRQ